MVCGSRPRDLADRVHNPSLAELVARDVERFRDAIAVDDEALVGDSPTVSWSNGTCSKRPTIGPPVSSRRTSDLLMMSGGLWPALQYVSVPSRPELAGHQRDEPVLDATPEKPYSRGRWSPQEPGLTPPALRDPLQQGAQKRCRWPLPATSPRAKPNEPSGRST